MNATDFKVEMKIIWTNYLNILGDRVHTFSDSRNVNSLSKLEDYNKYLHSIYLINNNFKLNILDWGSGNGHISYALKCLFPEANIISYTVNCEKRISMLFKDLKLNHINSSSPFDLPFLDGEINTIISSGVLEHVSEYGGSEEHSINELTRILKKEGYLMIWRLPFSWSIYEFLSYSFGKWYHPRRYTLSEIPVLFSRLYVKRIELDGFGFVRMRSFMRKFLISSICLNFLEGFLNRFKFFHFMLNDIFIICQKFSDE